MFLYFLYSLDIGDWTLGKKILKIQWILEYKQETFRPASGGKTKSSPLAIFYVNTIWILSYIMSVLFFCAVNFTYFFSVSLCLELLESGLVMLSS